MNFPRIFPGVKLSHLDAVAVQDEFQVGCPKGVTIHYTASRNLGSTVKELANKSLGYHLIIDRDGTIYQCAYFSHKVNHAGKAIWNELSPNRTHIAVSLISWGLLKEMAPGAYESWSGKLVATTDCVKRKGNWWDCATKEQELSLLRFLRWAVLQGVEPKDICGHDECAIPSGRKVDPGGVLSLDMPRLRYLLQDDLV